MVIVKQKGDFSKTEKFLNIISKKLYYRNLQKYAEQGVAALASATPIDSGTTANSWNYEIRQTKNSVSIYWTNSNVNKGVPIAVIIQYGHGTRNGGYVQGRDYINPAMRPIFDKIAENVWKEVISS